MAAAKIKELMEQLENLNRSEDTLKALEERKAELNRQLILTREQMEKSIAAFKKEIGDLEKESVELEQKIKDESENVSGNINTVMAFFLSYLMNDDT